MYLVFADFGRRSKFETEKLVVDPEVYFANRGSEKSLTIWGFVQGTIFKILSEHCIHCERIAQQGLKE